VQPGNKHCPVQLEVGEGWILMGEESLLEMIINLQMGDTSSASHNFSAGVLYPAKVLYCVVESNSGKGACDIMSNIQLSNNIVCLVAL